MIDLITNPMMTAECTPQPAAAAADGQQSPAKGEFKALLQKGLKNTGHAEGETAPQKPAVASNLLPLLFEGQGDGSEEPDEEALALLAALMGIGSQPVFFTEDPQPLQQALQPKASAVLTAEESAVPQMADLPLDAQAPGEEEFLFSAAAPASDGPKQSLEADLPQQTAGLTAKAEALPQQGSDGDEPFEGGDILAELSVQTPLFKDPESIPIKVAEAPRAAEAKESDPVQQLSVRIKDALDRGESRVELQLNPKSLGKVSVEMLWSKSGELRLTLTAQNPDTQKLLAADLSQLKMLLQKDGAQTVNIQLRQEQQSYDRNDEQSGGNGSRREPEKRKHHSQDFIQQLRLGLADEIS
ncbi:MAG: flagellar hook-length control protein FliK [Firmicutes bacterium]|nr:flagellar hook-length control protein FliK [Bacillota bacterium]